MRRTHQAQFDFRGSACDKARQRFSLARRAAFQQVSEAAKRKPGLVVADVPAGGGYVKSYLPDGCKWLGHEPCASFSSHGGQTEPSLPLVPLPWSDGHVDAAISLARIHHVEDKRSLFSDLFRVARSGGRLVASDMATVTAVARFLDGYVSARNSMGHEGVFLDERTLDALKQAGWTVEHAGNWPFHWASARRPDMAAFCHALFDLRTFSEAQTLKALESNLGVEDLPGGAGVYVLVADGRGCAAHS